MGAGDPEVEAIRRRIAEARRDLDDLERRRQQEAVEHLSPEERRKLIREWTRRLGKLSGVIAAGAALRWLWNRPGQVAAVTAMTTLGGVLVIEPPRIGEPDGPIPEAEHPLPQDVKPLVDRPSGPNATVSATIEPEADELEPGSTGGSETPAGPIADDATEAVTGLADDVAGDGATLLGEIEPEVSPEVQVPEPELELPELPQPSPEPAPSPEPTEPPIDEDEARALCLGLEDRPVVDLGACIRRLLGLIG